MKIFLQYVLPICAPFLIYYAWQFFQAKRDPEESQLDFSDTPWIKLLAAGVAITALLLVIFNAMSGEEPGGKYVSPTFKDGQRVPAHILRDE